MNLAWMRRICHLQWMYLFCIVGILAACDHTKRITLPGYIEGRYTYISSSFSGVLQTIYVHAGDWVQAGQPLFSLASLPESADLQASDARVQEAADRFKKITSIYNLQKSEFNRKQYLYKKGVISKEELDNATTVYLQSYSDIKSSESNLSIQKADSTKANWAVQQKVIKAPVASLVFDTYYTQGELVSSASPVLSLLAPDKVKIIFFVSEKIVSQIKLRQNINASCDGCKKMIKAKITYISTNAEFTPPVIYSQEQRAELVYRIEAFPFIENDLIIPHPGQPVSVHLELP